MSLPSMVRSWPAIAVPLALKMLTPSTVAPVTAKPLTVRNPEVAPPGPASEQIVKPWAELTPGPQPPTLVPTSVEGSTMAAAGVSDWMTMRWASLVASEFLAWICTLSLYVPALTMTVQGPGLGRLFTASWIVVKLPPPAASTMMGQVKGGLVGVGVGVWVGVAVGGIGGASSKPM